jgi:hypothetical protein
VRVSLRWSERPISIAHYQDRMGIGEVSDDKSYCFSILACVVWSLWKTRNDWVFNNVLIKSPKTVVYMAVGFLIQWKKMLKTKDKAWMEEPF